MELTLWLFVTRRVSMQIHSDMQLFCHKSEAVSVATCFIFIELEVFENCDGFLLDRLSPRSMVVWLGVELCALTMVDALSKYF